MVTKRLSLGPISTSCCSCSPAIPPPLTMPSWQTWPSPRPCFTFHHHKQLFCCYLHSLGAAHDTAQPQVVPTLLPCWPCSQSCWWSPSSQQIWLASLTCDSPHHQLPGWQHHSLKINVPSSCIWESCHSCSLLSQGLSSSWASICGWCWEA